MALASAWLKSTTAGGHSEAFSGACLYPTRRRNEIDGDVCLALIESRELLARALLRIIGGARQRAIHICKK
jgi:hypothetical protein